MAATALSIWQLDGVGRILVIVGAVAFLVGVQLPTFNFNIPLNNRVQLLNLDNEDEAVLANERRDFESPWNRWNIIRTFFACLTSVLLLIVVRLI